MATSLAPRTAIEYTSVNKEYKLAISKENFISQFNELQKKEIAKMGCNDCNFGYFDTEKGVFYSNNHDTLAFIIDINKHKNSDTLKISNYFADFQIYNRGCDTTILKLINIATSVKSHKLKNVSEDSLFANDTTRSKNTHYPYGYPAHGSIKNYDNSKWKERAIKEFEKRFIGKIKTS